MRGSLPPFLHLHFFLEVYHNRAIFPPLRSTARCDKLYYGYTGYIILGISASTLYRSLLLLSFLFFINEVTTYALQHGIVCTPRSRLQAASRPFTSSKVL